MQQEGEMKKAVLFAAGGFLVCVFLVVMGTYQREAAADEGRGKSTLKKKVDDLKKLNRPGQATCPFMWYFDGPARETEQECEDNADDDCIDQWDPYSSKSPPGVCSNSGCVANGGGECDSASTADWMRQCYNPAPNVWKAECRCHCWEDVK
jgi:hypothetical protein